MDTGGKHGNGTERPEGWQLTGIGPKPGS